MVKKAHPVLTSPVRSLVWTVTSWNTTNYTLNCNNSNMQARELDCKLCTEVLSSEREMLALLSDSDIKCSSSSTLNLG